MTYHQSQAAMQDGTTNATEANSESDPSARVLRQRILETSRGRVR